MSRSHRVTCALAALLVLVPAARGQDGAARLEQQCVEAIERANGLLKKVQEGQLTHAQALAEIDGIQTLLDEFAAADPRGAEPMQTELASIRFWINKMKPLFGPEDSRPSGGASGPRPADPRPEPRPEPRPGPRPMPRHDAPDEPEWHVPLLPSDAGARTQALGSLLGAQDARDRAWAAVRVPEAPRANLVSRLYDLLLGDADADVRAAARDGLLQTHHGSVLDEIAKVAEKASADQLDSLFEILQARPDPRTVQVLFRIVLDHEKPLPYVNERNKAAMDDFKKDIEAAFETGWRKRVFDVFRSWPGSTVVEGVGNYVVQSRDSRARQEALLTLGLYGHGRAAALAVPFLTADDNPLRATALATVEMIGLPAVPYLAQGLDRHSTKLWCYQALLNISDTRLGTEPRVWLQWWRQNR